jgi:retinol dehydrogenase-12
MAPTDAGLAGKQILITGATAGIGRAAAVELARRGASICVVARNPAKAADLDARVFKADLSDLGQVRAAAEEITASLERIDVLINNAGVAARRERRTAEGFDEMLTTNYLGPFLLTHLLLDPVRAAAPSRIVITGSEAHRLPGRVDPERFEDLGSYSGWSAQLAYGRTKLLDLLFADELARRLDRRAVTVNSLCPGMVNTELTREVPGADRVGGLLSATPLIRRPEQGARIIVRLAADADVAGISGQFWSSTPGAGLLPTIRARRDPRVAVAVYERTCKLVGVDPLPV